MLNFIFSFICLILFIVMCVIGHKRRIHNDVYAGITVGLMIISVCWVSVCIISHGMNMCTSDRDIIDSQIQYESLCNRLSVVNSKYENVSIDNLLKDVTEWNTTVADKKYRNDSLWLGWFINDKYIETLEYIDVDSIIESRSNKGEQK